MVLRGEGGEPECLSGVEDLALHLFPSLLFVYVKNSGHQHRVTIVRSKLMVVLSPAQLLEGRQHTGGF